MAIDAPLLDAHEVRHDRQKVAEVFGSVLKKERERLGIAQEDMANRAGVDRTVVSKMERGLSQPSLATIILLARGLEIEPGRLVDAANLGLGNWPS